MGRCRLNLVLLVTASLVFGMGTAQAAENYKIGVLAKNGPVKALQMWGATAEYLNAKLPGKTFEITPLDFKDVFPAVQEGRVSFFLVNSSMFVSAQRDYGASAIATMTNSRQGKALSAFGGVIFTAADNDAINDLADLRGKTFMAVDGTSFGGWQMAYKELVDAGVDPKADLAKLEFGGKHDNVVLAVVNGAVEAGTVRTDTIERMAADGLVSLDDVKVIHPVAHPGFPFLCSTALYPEWPLAKTSSTPDELAQAVATALRAMQPDDKAAKDAKVVGWSAPLDYAPVLKLQETLHLETSGN